MALDQQIMVVDRGDGGHHIKNRKKTCNYETDIQVRGASSGNEGVTAMALGHQMMVKGEGDGGHHIRNI